MGGVDRVGGWRVGGNQTGGEIDETLPNLVFTVQSYATHALALQGSTALFTSEFPLQPAPTWLENRSRSFRQVGGVRTANLQKGGHQGKVRRITPTFQMEKLRFMFHRIIKLQRKFINLL